jgi:triosephosphate isomerase
MRKKLLAANWKMYKTIPEMKDFIGTFLPLINGASDRDVVLGMPFTALATAAAMLKGTGVGLAAENLYPEEKGAFTGEISPVMLTDVGCTYVIVGHSERRQYFGETDEFINRKAKAALSHRLTPIVCVGERLEERERNRTMQVLETQVAGSLAGLDAAAASAVVIAYEPVWAIGTGKVATPQQAQEAHAFIRSQFARHYGAAAAASVRILYGGSVKPDNVREIMAQPDVDGGLVGGAALDPHSFSKIVWYDR